MRLRVFVNRYVFERSEYLLFVSRRRVQVGLARGAQVAWPPPTLSPRVWGGIVWVWAWDVGGVVINIAKRFGLFHLKDHSDDRPV